jgi:hypothetical protein
MWVLKLWGFSRFAQRRTMSNKVETGSVENGATEAQIPAKELKVVFVLGMPDHVLWSSASPVLKSCDGSSWLEVVDRVLLDAVVSVGFCGDCHLGQLGWFLGCLLVFDLHWG